MTDGPGGTPAREAYPEGEAFRGRAPAPLLERAVPLARDVRPGRGYGGGAVRGDVAAGLTVAALAVPSGMAYAELAGLSPVAGLYALLLPAVAYALLGSSRQLIVGPEGALAALVAAAVLPQAAAGSDEAGALAALLAVLVAAWFAVAWVARLGWVADYFSRPVLVGYIHGVAVVIVISQLPKLVGVPVSAVDPLPQLTELVRELGDVHGPTLALGVGAAALMLGLRRVAASVPAALVAVVLGIVLSDLLGLADHGVRVVGAVEGGLPALGVPDVGSGDVLALLPAAAGVFLVAFADEVLTARSYAGARGEHVDVGQELLGMGAANAAAGLSQGLPVGASGSRTAVNAAMGGRSQVAALVAAGAVLLVLLVLTGPIADLPSAVLGAAIVVAAIGLLAPAEWRVLWRADRVEAGIALTTAVGVIVVGVLEAVLVAVALSVFDVVRRSARPHDAVLGWSDRAGRYVDVALHPHATIVRGVVVYRLDDRLFFANAGYVRGRIHEALAAVPGAAPPSVLVLDAEAIAHVDSAGLDALGAVVDELHAADVDVRLARAKGALLEKLERGGVLARLGEDHQHGTVREAVAHAASPREVMPAHPRPGHGAGHG